jgi:outer membrane protein
MNRISAGLSTPLPSYPRDCSAFVLTPDQERAVLASNNAFPFKFSEQPLQAQLQVSLPIFTGFSRERQVETARVAEDDAKQQLRAQELALRTSVQAAYATLRTAEQTVRLEERNQTLAAQQLELEKERYRIGATNFFQLTDAETIRARADRAYLDALYAYHEAIAALEAAVGERLHTPTQTR